MRSRAARSRRRSSCRSVSACADPAHRPPRAHHNRHPGRPSAGLHAPRAWRASRGPGRSLSGDPPAAGRRIRPGDSPDSHGGQLAAVTGPGDARGELDRARSRRTRSHQDGQDSVAPVGQRPRRHASVGWSRGTRCPPGRGPPAPNRPARESVGRCPVWARSHSPPSGRPCCGVCPTARPGRGGSGRMLGVPVGSVRPHRRNRRGGAKRAWRAGCALMQPPCQGGPTKTRIAGLAVSGRSWVEGR